LTGFLLLEEVQTVKQGNKNLSLTIWVLCRNSVHCVLKIQMPQNLNGLEAHLPLTLVFKLTICK